MQISSKRRRHSKVDGCRRRALRAARAYAAHPSCRFLSRWVQRYWFQGTGGQGRAPIEFGMALISFLLTEMRLANSSGNCHVERPTGVETSFYISVLKISTFASLSRNDNGRNDWIDGEGRKEINRIRPSNNSHYLVLPL